MNKRILIFAVTIGFLLVSGLALAKHLPPTSVETLTKKLAAGESVTIEDQKEAADLVVWGEVKEVECKKEDWRIWTYTTIEPIRHYKGDRVKEVVIRYPGGKVPWNEFLIEWETATIIGGEPEFHRGQKVIVFLLKSEDNPWYELLLSGTSEYTVEENILLSNTGKKMSVAEFAKRMCRPNTEVR